MSATYKLCVIGDAKVGKTTYVNRILTGDFETRYIPTVGVEVRSLTMPTSKGLIVFDIWDCAGDERFAGLRDGYCIMADAAIIMIDRYNATEIDTRIRNFRSVAAPNAPVVVCWNKCDLAAVSVHLSWLLHSRDTEFPYEFYPISAKSCYNHAAPLLYIARSLLKDPQLIFTDAPNIPGRQ